MNRNGAVAFASLPPFIRNDLRRLTWREAVRLSGVKQSLLAWPLLRLGLLPAGDALTRVPEHLRDQVVDESRLDPELGARLARSVQLLQADGWKVMAYLHDVDSRSPYVEDNAGAYLLHPERHAVAFLSVARCSPSAPQPFTQSAGIVAWDAKGKYHGVTNMPYLDGPRGPVRRLIRGAGPLELVAQLDRLLPVARRAALDEDGCWQRLDRHQREHTAWRLRVRRDRPVSWDEIERTTRAAGVVPGMSVPDVVLGAVGIRLQDVTEVEFGGRRVLTFSVPGVQALAAWRALRAEFGQNGHWPVITGSEAFHPDEADEGELTRGEHAEALLNAWLDNELAGDAGEGLGASARMAVEAVQGRVAPPTLEEGVTGHRDVLTGKPLPRVYLALVPAVKPWEAPALLGFGGFNDCPTPSQHHTVLGFWSERYGLEAVTVSRDALEFAVARPPTHAEDALLLATQQLGYCPDIVHQGCETIPNLAASLLDNPVWYFWWD